MRESFLFPNPSQTSKGQRLKDMNLLNRYLKSEPLGAHHASLTLILIRGLVLELVGIKYVPCSSYFISSHLPVMIASESTPHTDSQDRRTFSLFKTRHRTQLCSLFSSLSISQPWIALSQKNSFLWTHLLFVNQHSPAKKNLPFQHETRSYQVWAPQLSQKWITT